MIATCTRCGERFKAERRSTRYCSAKCRKAAQRAAQSVQESDVTLSAASDTTLSVTRPEAWWRRRTARPVCLFCAMPILPAELAEGGYHAECARFVARKA